MSETETVYSLRKRIKELTDENNKLRADLYAYRGVVLKIYDGIQDIKDNGVSKNWILSCFRQCFK